MKRMITYSLDTLLYFFHRQQSLDYIAMDLVTGILEDENFPEEEKKDAILWMLRKYGLNEMDNQGGQFLPKFHTRYPTAELKVPAYERKGKYLVVQPFRVALINGPVSYEIPLN